MGMPHMLGLKNQAKGPSMAVPGSPRPPTSSQFIAVRFDLVHMGGQLIRTPVYTCRCTLHFGFAGPRPSSQRPIYQALGLSHTTADRSLVWHHLVQGCSACSSPCPDWGTAGCCRLPGAQGASGASQLGLAQGRRHRGHGCCTLREGAGQTRYRPATKQCLAHPKTVIKYWLRNVIITASTLSFLIVTKRSKSRTSASAAVHPAPTAHETLRATCSPYTSPLVQMCGISAAWHRLQRQADCVIEAPLEGMALMQF